MATSEQQRAFFAALTPFNLLPTEDFQRVVMAVDILYLDRDQTVLAPGDQPTGLHFIIKGMIREENEDGLVSFLGPEEYFDARSMITNRVLNTFTAIEESFCYFLPRSVWLDLAESHPEFRGYYAGLTRKLAALHGQDGSGSFTSMMTARVKDCEIPPPVVVEAIATIREMAILMQERKTDVVLVQREGRFGIVTSADIRNALAIDLKPVETRAEEIAAWNLVTISSHELLFNALLSMTKKGLRRLVVTSGRQVRGILGLSEVLSFMNNFTFVIIQRIDQAASVEELGEASGHQTDMVRALFAKGVKMRFIGRLIRELDRRILAKAAHLIAPPGFLERVCLGVMGSEGRGEQILKTDQDNALITEDGLSREEVQAFQERFVEVMTLLGYPPCPGEVMMCHPRWSGTLSQFKARILQWIDGGSPDDLMQLATLYDLHEVTGNKQLVSELRVFLLENLPDDQGFWTRFARPVMDFETPMGLFSRFITTDEASHKGLDIKKGGIFPIVHGVRALAMERRLPDTNTVRRIKGLAKLGIMDQECAGELIEAFDFFTSIRFRSRLEQSARGQAEDNYIQPEHLNRLEREILRDAFHIINRFKKFLNHHFRLHLLP